MAALGVIPVLMLAAIPYFFVRLQQLQSAVCSGSVERTPLERKAWYVNMLLTEVTAAKEIRLFDLGPRLRQWFQDARSVLRQERIALRAPAGRSRVLAAQIVGVGGVFGIYSFVAFQSRFRGCSPWATFVMYFMAVQRASAYPETLGQSVSSLYESNTVPDHVG